MSIRFSLCGLVAAVLLTGFASPAEAFGRRSSQGCVPVWCVCHPCCVYTVSEPVVKIDGPFPSIVRAAQVGHGVIVQVDVPTGLQVMPADVFNVIATAGTGEMAYEGYNKALTNPGTPGAPIRYSFFLCPKKAGPVTIEIGIVMSDNTIKKVPFSFNIAP